MGYTRVPTVLDGLLAILGALAIVYTIGFAVGVPSIRRRD